jgi:mannose-1-phosphate guanylyltransferase
MFLPVIMSGGSGERLWPVSRSSFPKPFVEMPDGQSLLAKAFLRAQSLPNVHEILTITNREHYFKTRAEYGSIKHEAVKKSYILEPFPRNTAPAVAIAAHYAAKMYGEDTVLLVLPADQLIEKTHEFSLAVAEAKKLAEQDFLVTFGISPTRAETGFGYIELPEETIENLPNSYLVKRFVEKPDLATAESYVSGGKHLWNAGIFCFKAGVFLRELEKHSPELSAAIDVATNELDWSQAAHGYAELDSDKFAEVPSISVDYAVMEKSDKVAVCKCDIGWNDVGSWNAIGDLIAPDDNGNCTTGEVYTHDSSGCLIQSSSRLVATVGVCDLVIIDTPDALLVADKSKVQEVKSIVGQLKENDHYASKEHTTIFRPWGCYTVLEERAGFKIKRIEVLPHHSLSLQKHEHRSEHWVVVSGVASVENNELIFELLPSQSTYIQAGHKHRLSNNSDEVLVIVEVQCGAYLGEDDITRFDDVYGRSVI